MDFQAWKGGEKTFRYTYTENRALQALVLQALAPEWEGRFEPNSYGFVRLVGAAERVPTLERATPPRRLCA